MTYTIDDCKTIEEQIEFLQQQITDLQNTVARMCSDEGLTGGRA